MMNWHEQHFGKQRLVEVATGAAAAEELFGQGRDAVGSKDWQSLSRWVPGVCERRQSHWDGVLAQGFRASRPIS